MAFYWLAAVPALADLALLILRLVIGLMFAMSGYFKLTDPQRKQKMQQSLKTAGVSPGLAPLVSTVELLAGLGLVLGFLTALSALGLLAIDVIALVTVIAPKLEGRGIHKLENLLYSSETVIAGALLVVLAVGAGAFSFDRIVFY